MFKEATKSFPDFNCDPEELERQQEIIKSMESWANNPLKFLEQYMEIKLHWYQKVWIIISSKSGYKNMFYERRGGWKGYWIARFVNSKRF